jgi:hypothetical protein
MGLRWFAEEIGIREVTEWDERLKFWPTESSGGGLAPGSWRRGGKSWASLLVWFVGFPLARVGES